MNLLSAVAGGASVGWLLLSLFTLVYYAAFEPQAFADAQFIAVFIFAIPFGVMLGALGGLCFSLGRQGQERTSGQIAAAGGFALVMLGLAITLASSDTRGGGIDDFLDTLRSGWIAPAIICSLVFAAWGIARSR